MNNIYEFVDNYHFCIKCCKPTNRMEVHDEIYLCSDKCAEEFYEELIDDYCRHPLISENDFKEIDEDELKYLVYQ